MSGPRGDVKVGRYSRIPKHVKATMDRANARSLAMKNKARRRDVELSNNEV